jgi:methylenetetrahydrofolate reductase (NADPH)
MAAQDPLFVDFTWGAGGSTSELTLELSVNTKKNFNMDVNMHMTCTNQEASKVDEGLEGAKSGNVRNICALRGDPPKGQDKWVATEGGFECALDLVKHIRASHGDYFGISVAGYPEGHPDNITPVKDLGRELSASEQLRVMVDSEGEEHVCCDENWAKEMAYLKEKVDAGGEIILTQLFYDTETFLQFVRDCRAWGINCPVLPGIMPIQAYGGFKKMTGFCKTRVPAEVTEAMEAIKDDTDAVKAYGIDFATKMCQQILASDVGVNGLHFYTLNLEKTVFAILDKLGLKKTLDSETANETENTLQGTHIV